MGKREDILKAAEEIFMQSGFHGASMDAIAAAAPVSKATLYSHFEDKNALFVNVLMHSCDEFTQAIDQTLIESDNPKNTLKTIALTYLKKLHSERSINLFRMMLAEVKQAPELGELIMNNGANCLVGKMSTYFDKLNAEKSFNIKDPQMAANMFLSMLREYTYFGKLLCVNTNPDFEKIAESAVDIFWRAYKS